jgi:hypothetical protein
MRSSAASSPEASSDDPVGVKWGHVEYVLGRPHELAWIKRQAQAVYEDPVVVLYLGGGALALVIGAVLYWLGRRHGSSNSDPPPPPPE